MNTLIKLQYETLLKPENHDMQNSSAFKTDFIKSFTLSFQI